MALWMKIVAGVLLVLVLFMAYVATRESKFRYERSGVINASAEKIFPYISEFKRGGEWSPYEKRDPNMKKTFSGTDGVPGAKMDFDGNAEVGAGSLELLSVEPRQRVAIRLIMTKPFRAENLVEYSLKPEGNGTRFTWTMSGDGGFMGKLLNTLIDCEKMVAGDFEIGIQNLKSLVESKP